MKPLLPIVLAGAMVLTGVPAIGQDVSLDFGGDHYAAGRNLVVRTPVVRDAFMAGSDVSVDAAVAGDVHLAGFDVNTNAAIAGNVYAFGFSVDINGAVGGNATAAGNSITLRQTSPIAGNARLAGEQVSVAAPIEGSALISAKNLSLDAPITGDLSFFGETIAFAPGARVDGKISIQAPSDIAVPASVASPDRVIFVPFAPPDYVSEAGRTAAESVLSRLWPGIWLATSGWLALLILGAAFIALMPKGVNRMQVVSEKRPFRKLGLGLLAFASLLGLVPVFVLTVVGIVAVPVVLVVVGIGCVLGYLAGVYFAGLRIANAFVRTDTNLRRLGVLAVALVAAGLLGIVPILGWLATLGLLVFGLGVIAAVLMVRWSSGDAARLQRSAGPAPAASPAE